MFDHFRVMRLRILISPRLWSWIQIISMHKTGYKICRPTLGLLLISRQIHLQRRTMSLKKTEKLAAMVRNDPRSPCKQLYSWFSCNFSTRSVFLMHAVPDRPFGDSRRAALYNREELGRDREELVSHSSETLQARRRLQALFAQRPVLPHVKLLRW